MVRGEKIEKGKRVFTGRIWMGDASSGRQGEIGREG